MTVQLLHGDCLELMKTLPDKSVDCFVCDLPYGQLASGEVQTNEELKKKYGRAGPAAVLSGCPWDIKIDLAAFWTQVKRLAKNDHTPVLMFCNTKFGYELIKSNEEWFRYDIVWDKGCGVSFLLANKMPMKSHEMVYVFAKKGAYYKRIDEDDETMKARKATDVKNSTRTIAGKLERIKGVATTGGKRVSLSVLRFRRGGRTKGHHPTEKPIELYEWLLARYVPEGGTVLDPTAGSFNSILAAKNLKFNAIGIEKDDKFFEAGKKKFPESPTVAETPLRNEVVLQPAGGAGDAQ